MTESNNSPVVLEDAALADANGGLLLPAVQKVREAAARMSSSGLTKTGAGALTLGGTGAVDPSNPNATFGDGSV